MERIGLMHSPRTVQFGLMISQPGWACEGKYRSNEQAQFNCVVRTACLWAKRMGSGMR